MVEDVIELTGNNIVTEKAHWKSLLSKVFLECLEFQFHLHGNYWKSNLYGLM